MNKVIFKDETKSFKSFHSEFIEFQRIDSWDILMIKGHQRFFTESRFKNFTFFVK